MKFPAAFCGLIFLSACLLLPAEGVQVSEQSAAEKSEGVSRVFLISAVLDAESVLVVRGTRWENGRKTIQWEDVFPADAQAAQCRISLTEAAAQHWVLHEFATEQHVRGVQLANLKLGSNTLGFELVPAGEGRPARQRYRFNWEAKVETWAAVRKRYPELTDEVRAAGRPTRHLLAADALDAGF